MDKTVKVSICIPTHDFPKSEYFLNRCLDSIRGQTFQDYEIIIKKTGKGMAHNLNEAIKEARGEFIKVLFTDDYFHDKNALKRIVDAHRGHWSVTGCIHTDASLFEDEGKLFNPHFASWNNKLVFGENTIGSPSVLFMKNEDLPLWDENLSWLVDCDYYQKLYDLFGKPNIIDDINVIIGLHPNQETHLLSSDVKENEEYYVREKYKTS